MSILMKLLSCVAAMIIRQQRGLTHAHIYTYFMCSIMYYIFIAEYSEFLDGFERCAMRGQPASVCRA